jgi:hypothetical protein
MGLFCLLLLSSQMRASTHRSPADVNAKVIKAFQEAFPQATTVDWKESGDFYFVHFKEKESVMQIEYDHDGNFIESDKFYTDTDLLPAHLVWELNKRFKGKTIFGVTEVNTELETNYFVKMQDDKEWITVKGNATGIDYIVERYKKQQP